MAQSGYGGYGELASYQSIEERSLYAATLPLLYRRKGLPPEHPNEMIYRYSRATVGDS